MIVRSAKRIFLDFQPSIITFNIMKTNIVLSILLLGAIPFLGFSQDSLKTDLSYGVHVNYPYLSITKEQLKNAETLQDLNKRFQTTWINEYLSVDILTTQKGESKRVVGKDSTLTKEQRNQLISADSGTQISIMVQYIPENNLKNNPPREMDFTLFIEPERKAEFPGGDTKLIQYLTENFHGNIPDDVFRKYQLAAVTFTVDKEGYVTDSQLFWTSENDRTDKLMLDVICNMPKWKPAEYADGTKVDQNFALTVGDMKSCIVNMLNIDWSVARLGNFK